MTTTNNNNETEKAIKEYQDYAKNNGFSLNPDKETVARIIKGLFENERKHGARYCPCRRVAGNLEEDKKIICPCEFHRAEIKEYGYCLCRLFVKQIT